MTLDGINDSPPKYQSDLPLEGTDSNAFAILARIDRGLRKAGAPADYRQEVQDRMTAGDYDNLLSLAVRYTTISAVMTHVDDDPPEDNDCGQDCDGDHATCDICGGIEHNSDMTPDWNGETGCHESCESDE